MICDLHTVNVINSSCTEMVTALLFHAFKVRSLHGMMSACWYSPLQAEHIPLLKAMKKHYV